MADLSIQELFGVKGKVALVTGGSRGIGFMIASALIQNGVKTYIVSRKHKDIESASQQLNAQSKNQLCIPFACDLSSSTGVDQLVEFIKSREQKLDILVNNAGANWAEDFEKYSEKAFDKVINLNLKSIFVLTQKLLPLLKAAGSRNHPSRIINVGSINGINPPMFPTYAYSASKAALHMLTRHMALHLSHLNPSSKYSDYFITVNTVAPGSFPSKMMAQTLETFSEQIQKSNPCGRIGNESDIAAVILWLCGKGGSYVNGATIVVDGGAIIVPAMNFDSKMQI